MDVKVLSLEGNQGIIEIYASKSRSGWLYSANSHPDAKAVSLAELLMPLRDTVMSSVPRDAHPLFSGEIFAFVQKTARESGIKASELERWRDVLTRQNPVWEAAKAVHRASGTVVLTGAGASQDAGIPDFRSKEGWWKQVDPRQVATVEALEHRYRLFHEFYAARIAQLEDVIPHEGHQVLAGWEKEGEISCIATQNVDGLHQKAGNERVYELHGSILKFRCHRCQRPSDKDSFLNMTACSCGGKLRPDVVLFGETLPAEAWDNALAEIQKADVVLVIGTSLQVYPVNQLPFMSRGRLILINKDLTGEEDRFDIVIQGGAEDCLRAMDRWVALLKDKERFGLER